ncbi:pilus assembly protein [Burkholderia multivorans]|uniref:pilus assembly protein n=1 Tax=Burkholderia ubonensis TaxID=101571 RepID=UPI000F6FD326|nr:pilus assembly protein [Burkholderia ubonensis]AYZ67087.1 pilus assembly protein [Burkholderia multivorans]VWB14045.1 pilus assembly protein [Burkholderia ubonensis]
MTAPAYRFGIGDGGRNGAARRALPVASHVAGCVLAFGVVLAGGVHLSAAEDWSGLARSRASLDAARARAAEAERALAQAAMHRAAPAKTDDGRGAPAAPGWPALMLDLAELAASSGLRVVSIEPQPEPGARQDVRRTVRIVADGGFPALRRMVGALATLPVLVVPTAINAERAGRAARVGLSLDVFPAMPGGRAAYGDRPIAVASQDADPFGIGDEPGTGDTLPSRLAGVMRDARTGLALFDDGAGAITAVAAGETVGAMRVVRVEADAVTLATRNGPRRMGLDDEGMQW